MADGFEVAEERGDVGVLIGVSSQSWGGMYAGRWELSYYSICFFEEFVDGPGRSLEQWLSIFRGRGAATSVGLEEFVKYGGKICHCRLILLDCKLITCIVSLFSWNIARVRDVSQTGDVVALLCNTSTACHVPRAEVASRHGRQFEYQATPPHYPRNWPFSTFSLLKRQINRMVSRQP